MSKTPLFLHIGVHKTGTTSIQSAFRDNATAIADQTGLHYLPFPNRDKGSLWVGGRILR